MSLRSPLASLHITPRMYAALAEALWTVHWNRAPFERYLRLALRAHPQVLSQLDFNAVKRAVAGHAVEILAAHPRYIPTVVEMMTDLAETTSFPHLSLQPDAAHLISRAQ